ncbi:MAG: LysR family transcriptional regulator ArgP [Corynebacterium sp.]|nr:LysR family transcriptional regulator ArgP [Corynebacterium sp.]
MNPVQLETLLAIVDEGSFELAASVLGITPSAVSQRIKALESATGRVLLRRSTPVTATDAGEILVQAARRMALVQAETNARLGARLRRVPLAVAINNDSLSTWFRPVIADVAKLGDAALRLRIEDEARTLSMLRRGDVLGAVTREKTPVSGCESTYLGTVRYMAVATPEIRQRYITEAGMAWQQMPIVLYGPQDAIVDEAMRERGIEPHIIRGRVSQIPSSEAYLDAIRVGLGWGLVPDTQAAELIDASALVLLDDSPKEIDLYWQRWRLESDVLEKLTRIVLSAAQTHLIQTP